MVVVDYYFSVLSPYTYLAGARLESVAATRGAEIHYRPFDTRAVFAATGGKPVAERHPARQAYRLQDLRRRALRENMPLNLSPRFYPTDPRPASTAVIAAQAAGACAGLLAQALLRAVWAEEKDIADPTVVSDALNAAGVSIAATAPHQARAAAAFEANAAAAIDAGVFGAPFYVVGDELFWGQDRLEDLDAHLAHFEPMDDETKKRESRA